MSFLSSELKAYEHFKKLFLINVFFLLCVFHELIAALPRLIFTYFFSLKTFSKKNFNITEIHFKFLIFGNVTGSPSPIFFSSK